MAQSTIKAEAVYFYSQAYVSNIDGNGKSGATLTLDPGVYILTACATFTESNASGNRLIGLKIGQDQNNYLPVFFMQTEPNGWRKASICNIANVTEKKAYSVLMTSSTLISSNCTTEFMAVKIA